MAGPPHLTLKHRVQNVRRVGWVRSTARNFFVRRVKRASTKKNLACRFAHRAALVCLLIRWEIQSVASVPAGGCSQKVDRDRATSRKQDK